MWEAKYWREIWELKCDEVDRRKWIIERFGKTVEQCFAQEFEAKQAEIAQLRWVELLEGSVSETDPLPYPPGLLLCAQRTLPWPGPHTVSQYVDWIYRMQHPRRWDALEQGKRGEREVDALRRTMSVPSASGWRLIHNGMKDDIETRRITPLSIGGVPMTASPDLVFEHLISDTLLFIEIKFSNADCRHSGWSNVKAQLWAYAQIDEWRPRHNLLLAAEVWAKGQYVARLGDFKRGHLKRRITWVYDRHDDAFDSWNRRLFEIYKAHRTS